MPPSTDFLFRELKPPGWLIGAYAIVVIVALAAAYALEVRRDCRVLILFPETRETCEQLAHFHRRFATGSSPAAPPSPAHRHPSGTL